MQILAVFRLILCEMVKVLSIHLVSLAVSNALVNQTLRRVESFLQVIDLLLVPGIDLVFPAVVFACRSRFQAIGIEVAPVVEPRQTELISAVSRFLQLRLQITIATNLVEVLAFVVHVRPIAVVITLPTVEADVLTLLLELNAITRLTLRIVGAVFRHFLVLCQAGGAKDATKRQHYADPRLFIHVILLWVRCSMPYP